MGKSGRWPLPTKQTQAGHVATIQHYKIKKFASSNPVKLSRFEGKIRSVGPGF